MKTDGGKNIRRIDPLYTTDIYYSYFDHGQTSVNVPYGDGTGHKFDLLKRYEDPKTGFVGASFINKDDGHAILLYKGMDVPFRDQGGGHFRFLKDIWTIAQGHLNGASAQHEKAEQAYLETIGNPGVRDMEVAGFSMGTIFTNYMAAKYGAKGTVFADLGIADSALEKLFNQRAENKALGVHPAYILNEMEDQMRDNVVVLKMKADLLPRIFALGPSRGRSIDLDAGPEADPDGIHHSAGIYLNQAGKIDPLGLRAAPA
jgi:hypothetical protein